MGVYLDGDKERGMKKHLIRKVGGSTGFDTDGDDEDKNKFKVGTAIEARYNGKAKWYKGKISRVNANGTYDVLYSDGDKERGVKKHLIRKVGGSAGSDGDDSGDEKDKGEFK